jgi:Flp pilus assembly protein protease CpaA
LEVLVTLSFDQLLLLLSVTLTLSAAISDVRTGLIPNRLVLCFALALVCLRGLGVALGLAPPATLLDDALYGALFAACVPLLLYVCGGLGGGDLKLLVVCGAALGPPGAAHLQLYAFTLGAAFVLLRLTYRGVLFRTLWRSARTFRVCWPGRRAGVAAAQEPMQAVRFAPAVSVAALLVMVERW